MKIENASAIVTGGASGLGFATAQMLASRGAKVALFDLPGAQLDAAAKDLGAVAAPCDVTCPEAVAEALNTAIEANGLPSIVVNCAGVTHGERIVGRTGAASLEGFSRTVQVNLIGTFNVLRLAAEKMSQAEPQNDNERGVIINTSSAAAFEGQIGQAAYAASKGGVASLTLPAARELARSGIRVLAIAPGIFSTPMMETLPQEIQDSLGAKVPFPSRLGKPSEFAQLAGHMIENTMLNGECVRLDGAIRLEPK
ncbi:3-hydroxyacyl-CoA dehydrogenase [Phaeobacter gallaeciensis]|uniref:3-hydroxyacyl-CoA dehydrogenase n=2 Tax=Roseobacteraceae TaxID=2854170 RepID=A0A366X2G8_9RHOB|nr:MULTISPECIES: SDR family NAD(P)-dependent oxidoreductase [Roseobacteraceae]MBT3142563.1 SDR family NAD(P)-dependent oxidoreductase [Falsiruegeria litorea]RBW58375.1 3-hydroxyacyl-CoA dehydrogenase [Phaeobacter gallaeciensis]